jgi:uncharacterized glyoxalase superfamily protein PhnB
MDALGWAIVRSPSSCRLGRINSMLSNRSMPRSIVIPELAYPDIGDAIDWLCTAFGFTLRIRIADHRAQLNVGDGGAVVLIEQSGGASLRTAVMVRVEDVNAHYDRARRSGGRIGREPTDYPYGERQYIMLRTSPGTIGVSRNPLRTLIQEIGAERPPNCSVAVVSLCHEPKSRLVASIECSWIPQPCAGHPKPEAANRSIWRLCLPKSLDGLDETDHSLRTVRLLRSSTCSYDC